VKSNLAALRKRSAQYSVDTMSQKAREFERDRAIEGGGETGEDTRAEGNLCALPSADRKEKEIPIRSRFSTRTDTALNKLTSGVAEKRLQTVTRSTDRWVELNVVIRRSPTCPKWRFRSNVLHPTQDAPDTSLP